MKRACVGGHQSFYPTMRWRKCPRLANVCTTIPRRGLCPSRWVACQWFRRAAMIGIMHRQGKFARCLALRGIMNSSRQVLK
jgi:hypothetical protein